MQYLTSTWIILFSISYDILCILEDGVNWMT
jgi:hypothetical protein